jgi:hypothetical protein
LFNWILKTKKSILDSKKTLKAVQKVTIDSLKKMSREKSEQAQKFSKKNANIIHILDGSKKWKKGLDDFPYLVQIVEDNLLPEEVIISIGKTLSIEKKRRAEATFNNIRNRIISEHIIKKAKFLINQQMKKHRLNRANNSQRSLLKSVYDNDDRTINPTVISDTTQSIFGFSKASVDNNSDIMDDQDDLSNSTKSKFINNYYIDSMKQDSGFFKKNNNNLLSNLILPKHTMETLVRKGLEETKLHFLTHSKMNSSAILSKHSLISSVGGSSQNNSSFASLLKQNKN